MYMYKHTYIYIICVYIYIYNHICRKGPQLHLILWRTSSLTHCPNSFPIKGIGPSIFIRKGTHSVWIPNMRWMNITISIYKPYIYIYTLSSLDHGTCSHVVFGYRSTSFSLQSTDRGHLRVAYGVFHSKGGTPIAGWFIMENPSVNSRFRGTPISRNLHMNHSGVYR